MNNFVLSAYTAVGVSFFCQFSQASISMNFDSAGDLLANFNPTEASGLATESASAGFDGTRGIDLSTATGNHAFVFDGSFSGDLLSWGTSVFYNPSASPVVPLTLGFISTDQFDFSAFTPIVDGASASLANILPSISFQVGPAGQALLNTLPGVAPSTIDSDNRALSEGTWYEASLQVSYNGSNEYSVTGTTWELDAFGDRTSALAVSSGLAVNASLASDAEVFTYFSVHAGGGEIDNFSTSAVVPEPSVYGLLFGTVSLVVLTMRRRR